MSARSMLLAAALVAAAVAPSATLLAQMAVSTPVARVTPGHLCGALAQAGIVPGTQREGHTLASVSCSGGPSVFNVRVVIR